MVAQQAALGRLERRADELALRERIEKRRRLFAARRAGASKKHQLREQLLDIAAEIVAKYVKLVGWSENDFLCAIGELAWDRGVADFQQRYPADRLGLFDPQYRKPLVDSVRYLIGPEAKALQIAAK